MNSGTSRSTKGETHIIADGARIANAPPRRQEGLQRVQIGLTGLAGVILLVGLANIVIDKAQMDERAMPPPVVPTLNTDSANASGQPREPLAELGVTPSAEQSGQVVPDLQPDPNLRQPMDRDPQQ